MGETKTTVRTSKRNVRSLFMILKKISCSIKELPRYFIETKSVREEEERKVARRRREAGMGEEERKE